MAHDGGQLRATAWSSGNHEGMLGLGSIEKKKEVGGELGGSSPEGGGDWGDVAGVREEGECRCVAGMAKMG